jgi:very-short-patch-repair endonuclease
MPAPRTNRIVPGYEVDAFSPDANLIVEVDGYAAHGTRRAFQADRERDRRLIGAGFRAIRLTPFDLATGASLARDMRGLLKSCMTVGRRRPGAR